MKNTIQKSIDVISGLVQKHIIINNRIKENILNQQNYQNLNNKLNNLLELIDSNISTSSTFMEFYKCVAVYGPHEVACFEISGCPESSANGTYMPTENTTEDWDGNKQPVYSNGTYYYYYEPNDYMEWGISTDYTEYLSYRGGVGSSWSDSNWNEITGMSCVESTVIVDMNVPKTWDGYKATLKNGVYSFEQTLTTGLNYGGGFTPEKGYIYPDGCLLRIGALWLGYDSALVFYAPLADNTTVAVTGQKISLTGNGGFTTFKGIPCCYGMRILTEDENNNIPILAQPRTIAGWACFNNTQSVWIFAFGSGGNDSNTLALGCKDGKFMCYSSSSILQTDVTVSVGEWYHLLVTYNGSTIKMFINGVKSGQLEKKLETTNDPGVYAGYLATQNNFDFNGYVAGIRVYNRALSTDEILQLSKEFTPTTE